MASALSRSLSPNSYRGVTLTPVIDKCFEFALPERLQPIPEDTVFLPLGVGLSKKQNKKKYGGHDQGTMLLTYRTTHPKSSALNEYLVNRVPSAYEYAAPPHLRRRAITSVFVQARPQRHQKVLVAIT